jgi:hypothetical protein
LIAASLFTSFVENPTEITGLVLCPDKNTNAAGEILHVNCIAFLLYRISQNMGIRQFLILSKGSLR